MVERSPVTLNVLMGIPDRAQKRVKVTLDGRRLIGRRPAPGGTIFIGSVNLASHLDRERFRVEQYFLQKGRVSLKFAPGPIMNHIADPDTCSGALAMATKVVNQAPGRPCFNRPEAIEQTKRHEVARKLAGIPSLIVPKTIRVNNTTPGKVRHAIGQANLSFPVLIRGTGTHGGADLIKADKPSDVEEIAWVEPRPKELYITEFHDFKSPDGYYRKFRIVVVGDEIFLRHCVISDKWLLHGRRRADGVEALEINEFAQFDRDVSSHVLPVFREIRARLGLDYFGVDCNIDDEGRVLLFEANACMNVLHNYRPSPNKFDTPIARIKAAVEEYLAAPAKWASPGALSPTVARSALG